MAVAQAGVPARPEPAPTATAMPTATPTPPARRAEPSAPQAEEGRGAVPRAGRRDSRAPSAPKPADVDRLSGPSFSFPIYGAASVSDGFGAPRAQGAHQGNDLFADFGAPVLAVADGTLERVGTLPISGNRLWLRTDAGDAFFYAHLSAFAPAAVNGRRVTTGTVLGFVGNTGDAEPTPPHVHFEIHPAGGPAIDPYAVLTSWQERDTVRDDDWLARYGGDTEPRPGALVPVRDFIAGG